MARIPKDKLTQLVSASQAKAAATTAVDDAQLEAVAHAINTAANTGEYSVVYQSALTEATKIALEGQNYKLRTIDRGLTTSATVISWK